MKKLIWLLMLIIIADPVKGSMMRNMGKIIKREKKSKMKAVKKIKIINRVKITKMRINRLIALNNKKLYPIQIPI